MTTMPSPAHVLPSDLGQLVERLELQISKMSAALVAGDVAAMAEASQGVHGVVEDAARFVASPGQALPVPAPIEQRLYCAQRQLSRQREMVARRAVGVNRALRTLLPQAEANTYGAQGGMAVARVSGAHASYTSLHA